MSLPRYVWQPTSAEIAAAAGIPIDEVERFDHNTSPFPTRWAVDVVAAAASGLNEYPAASYATLRAGAAAVRGVDPAWIVPGAGVDELILLAARAFLAPGDTSAAAEPTYPLYRIATAQAGAVWAPVQSAPPGFAFPAAEVAGASRTAAVTWLCIPANPVGNRPAPAEVEAVLAAAGGVVVVDAAYAEFADDDWRDVVARRHNVLALHTLSKAYGIGGARVGYAVGHADLIAALDGVRPPGSLSSLSVQVAIAALADPQRMQRTVAELSARRAELASRLGALGLRVLPSEANFLLCEVGPHAHLVEDKLLAEGLVVRKFATTGPLADYLRFTIRTDRAHDRLIDALERSL